MATLGTDDSGHCREVYKKVNVQTWPLKRGSLCGEVAISGGLTVFNIHLQNLPFNCQQLFSVYKYPILIQSQRLITVNKSGCKHLLSGTQTSKITESKLHVPWHVSCNLEERKLALFGPPTKRKHKYFVKIWLRQLTHTLLKTLDSTMEKID